jgi:hypothetical protein
MWNYSQVLNMIWTRGIRITTQSEYIISSPNNDKVRITNVQLALKTTTVAQSKTNYVGDEVDLIDAHGGDDGVDGYVDEDASPTSKRSGDDDVVDFPFTGGTDSVGSALSRSRVTFASAAASINLRKNMA